MKKWIYALAIILGVFILSFYVCFFHWNNSSNYMLKRPPDLPPKAIWAGGIDGGAWFVVDPKQPAPNVWKIKIYGDTGRPWVRGDFWWKDAPHTKSFLCFSFFDGRAIYLQNGGIMLPVGEHFYPHSDVTTIITYPSPSFDYIEAQEGARREDKPESW